MLRAKALGFLMMGALVALAGCGGTDSGSTGGSDAGTPAGAGGATVQQQDVPGAGSVLTDAAGNVLYFAEQEKDGTIKCAEGCTHIWQPLTVDAGTTPTAGSGVTGTVGTVTRSDGATQVTYNSMPLYTFTLDGGPNKATGENAMDSFGGVDFVWHVVTADGAAAPAPSGAASPPDYNYGY